MFTFLAKIWDEIQEEFDDFVAWERRISIPTHKDIRIPIMWIDGSGFPTPFPRGNEPEVSCSDKEVLYVHMSKDKNYVNIRGKRCGQCDLILTAKHQKPLKQRVEVI